jgi:UrcA family protein
VTTKFTKEIIMKSTIKSSIPLALTAALLTCVLGAPSAFADDQVRSEMVKFQDLNLNTPEGIHRLYGRIHIVAQRVCSESDVMRRPVASACERKAEGDAVEKLNLPQLTAYYKMKTKTGDQTQPLVASR